MLIKKLSNELVTCFNEQVEFSPLLWEGRYVIRRTASYKRFDVSIFNYYQSQKVSYKYQKNETCNLSKIDINYECQGSVYSYPGSGSPFVGQFITFSTVVDGEKQEYTIRMRG